LNSIPDMDVNQKHIYKNTLGIPSEIDRYETTFGKPYVIGEFGYEWDWSKNFDDFADGMDIDFKRGLWLGLFSSTPVLPMSWWWEYFDHRGTDKYIARVRTIADRMMSAGGGSFAPVKMDSIAGTRVMAVKCGKKTFVYIGNITGAAIKVSAPIKGQLYDPEKGTFSKLKKSFTVDPNSNVILLD